MKIGFAGTGNMASAMAQRLIDCGHAVAVWNRTPDRTKAAAAAGATVLPSAAAIADWSDVVISVLSDEAAINAVYRGPQGVLTGDLGGKLVIDMSTVRPHVAAALGAEVAARGAIFVDCPVGGTIGPAREGRLLGFVGGKDADVARAMPILDQLCRRVEHMGPVGSGARMKLAINLPLLVFYQAMAEAWILCRSLGVDATRIMDIFADTSGGPNVLKTRAPVIAKALKGEPTGPVGFDVDLIRKDLRTMKEEAQALGANLPLVEQTLAIYDRAAEEGWGQRDGATLPAYWPSKSV